MTTTTQQPEDTEVKHVMICDDPLCNVYGCSNRMRREILAENYTKCICGHFALDHDSAGYERCAVGYDGNEELCGCRYFSAQNEVKE